MDHVTPSGLGFQPLLSLLRYNTWAVGPGLGFGHFFNAVRMTDDQAEGPVPS